VFGLLLSFGVCFQLPVLVVLLNQLGWVTLARLKKSRAMVVLGAAVVGMLLTPPDVISQLILGGVLVLLYELGLWATVGLRCLQHRKK
jgi:sec-independent protein translocase protein TatC